MATLINTECINCAACEPECPNTAIYQGGIPWVALDGSSHPAISDELFYIVPEKCTECVGFFDQEACAKVCPVDACVPDPAIPEAEAVLLARARTIHPDKAIPDDAPSRFRTGAAASTAPAVGAAPAVSAPKAPAAPAGAAPAAAAPKAAPRPSGRVEKPTVKPRKPRPPKSHGGELHVDFDQLLLQLGAPRRLRPSLIAKLGLPMLAITQGVLGALPAAQKRRIEARVADGRFFSAELATAGNALLNLILYPVGFVVAATISGTGSVFSSNVRWPIMYGVTIGVLEAMWRLRETVFRGVPLRESPLRAAFYGPALVPVGGIISGLTGDRGATSSVGYDGFSQQRESFDDRMERARRYGEVYRLEERDDAYLLRMEFPRVLPPSSLREQLGLPVEMPDYDFDLAIQGNTFVVNGRVDDPDVKKITGAAGSFPSTFVTRIPLRDAVDGFRHRYRDKILEVILPKAAA